MSVFFNDTEAALRYEKYRPKIHSRIIDKIRPLMGDLPKASALDVACGTGDSSAALRAIANYVVATDTSKPMLQLAAKHSNSVELLSAERLSELNQQFDIVSVCMAFHWFEQVRVIPAFKAVTKLGGYWLIYNLSFAGQPHNRHFSKSQESYLSHYPTPPRHSRVATSQLKDDPQLKTITTLSGSFDVSMDRESLVGYLSTQSNVQATVIAGKSYEAVEAHLKEIYADLHEQSTFQFYYSVELYQLNAH